MYIQPFPSLDRRVQVSAGGGTEPVWSRDGKILYFRRGNAVLRAPIETGARLSQELGHNVGYNSDDQPAQSVSSTVDD